MTTITLYETGTSIFCLKDDQAKALRGLGLVASKRPSQELTQMSNARKLAFFST